MGDVVTEGSRASEQAERGCARRGATCVPASAAGREDGRVACRQARLAWTDDDSLPSPSTVSQVDTQLARSPARSAYVRRSSYRTRPRLRSSRQLLTRAARSSPSTPLRLSPAPALLADGPPSPPTPSSHGRRFVRLCQRLVRPAQHHEFFARARDHAHAHADRPRGHGQRLQRRRRGLAPAGGRPAAAAVQGQEQGRQAHDVGRPRKGAAAGRQKQLRPLGASVALSVPPPPAAAGALATLLAPTR